MNQPREALPLSEAVTHLLEECRMVLPGIQALFGFQLIAVFNSRFAEKLTSGEQGLHLLAIGLVVIAVGIIMTPAALHRQTCPTEVTESFIRVSSFLMLCSMLPLALAICIDFYLVAHVIVEGTVPAILAGGLFAILALLWFVVPRVRIMQRMLGG